MAIYFHVTIDFSNLTFKYIDVKIKFSKPSFRKTYHILVESLNYNFAILNLN